MRIEWSKRLKLRNTGPGASDCNHDASEALDGATVQVTSIPYS